MATRRVGMFKPSQENDIQAQIWALRDGDLADIRIGRSHQPDSRNIGLSFDDNIRAVGMVRCPIFYRDYSLDLQLWRLDFSPFTLSRAG